MNNFFPEFYRPSSEDFKKMFDDCIFVLDTNVLLNLYRYTDSTREQLLSILNKLKGRVWIPHQTGLEYHYNRPSVVIEQKLVYSNLCNDIKNSFEEFNSVLDKKLSKYNKQHSTINFQEIRSEVGNSIISVIEKLVIQEEEHQNSLEDDEILNKIIEVIGENVGPAYSQEELDKIYTEGKERYEKKRPPGYEDLKDKEGEYKHYNDLTIKNEYGDLIIWKQILDKAIEEKGKPIIFITDDNKEDWWYKLKGRTISPRVELLNEMNYIANTTFYMYLTDNFMRFAQDYLHEDVNAQAIKEVQDLRRFDAEHNKSLSARKMADYLKNKKVSNFKDYYKIYKEFNGDTSKNINKDNNGKIHNNNEKNSLFPLSRLAIENIKTEKRIRNLLESLDLEVEQNEEFKYRLNIIKRLDSESRRLELRNLEIFLNVLFKEE